MPTPSPFEVLPELADARVRLRPVRPADARAIREISVYDGVPAATEAAAVAMLARIERDRARGEALHWGVCLRGGDEVVGTCGFYRGFVGNVGEVGYLLREAYRGRGLMTAAVRLVVAYGLDTLRLDAIVAHTAADNHASMRLLRRVGFAPAAAPGAGRAFRLERGAVA